MSNTQTTNSATPHYCRPGDVDQYVPVGKTKVYRGISEGWIKAKKFGGTTMVDLHHLMESIENSPDVPATVGKHGA